MSAHTATVVSCLVIMSGVLYVVATPIGNLQDITRRGITTLSGVQIIAAEDTRRARVLLEEIGGTQAELLALHDHNEAQVTKRVVAALEQGVDVALISDAGTPLLSDPGFGLVARCWELGQPVVPIPGASAVAAVLSVCPLPAQRFYFHGFLAARAGQRREQLKGLLARSEASVFFEAPHRVAHCLADLAALAPERRLFLGREMTKRFEQFLLGTPAELAAELEAAQALRGEFVCVLEAAQTEHGNRDVRDTMAVLVGELTPSQAARIGAALLGVSRRELYALAQNLKADA